MQTIAPLSPPSFPLVQQLTEAARRNDAPGVHRALDAGAPINQSDRLGWTALRHAADRGNTDALQALIERGADIHAGARYAGDMTILHHAAQAGGALWVRLLLAAGAEVEACDRTGATALLVAAGCQSAHAGDGRHREVAEALVVAGADVNRVDNFGTTPLHDAARTGADGLTRFLLAHGARPDVRDRSGLTPLLMALVAASGYGTTDSAKTEVVRLLLDAGAEGAVLVPAESLAGRHPQGTTALHLAARHAPAAVIILLLDRGAKLRARNSKGETPLGYALASPANFATLFAAGADVSDLPPNPKGKPPLFVAAESKHVTAVTALLAAGHDADRLYRGKTALHIAVAKADISVIAVLLGAGADHRSLDKDGVSPLDLARRRRRKAVAALLEAAEAARVAAT